MMFVDWNAACIEPGDALSIDVRANHFMPSFRKASSGNETYVPTTDDGKTQDELSLKMSFGGRKPHPLRNGNSLF
jgi:hypothetical protein